MARFVWVKNCQVWLMLGALCTSTLAHGESLLVGGTGSAEPLIKLLFAEFARQFPAIQASAVHPALGSSGGINALMNGKIDLAIVSRGIKANEKPRLGRNFSWCNTPFVMVSNGGQRRNGFSTDELARVYLGQLSTWENGAPIRLVLRNIDDSDSVVLKSMSPAMEKAVNAANERAGMVFGTDDLETLAIESRTPGSLGPSTLGLLQTSASSLRVMPINGVIPTVENLKNASYPWHKTLTVLLPLKPSAAAEKFATFLQSEKANAILIQYQYQPIKP